MWIHETEFTVIEYTVTGKRGHENTSWSWTILAHSNTLGPQSLECPALFRIVFYVFLLAQQTLCHLKPYRYLFFARWGSRVCSLTCHFVLVISNLFVWNPDLLLTLKPIKILMFKPCTTQIFVGGTQFNLTLFGFGTSNIFKASNKKMWEKSISYITYQACRSTWWLA